MTKRACDETASWQTFGDGSSEMRLHYAGGDRSPAVRGVGLGTAHGQLDRNAAPPDRSRAVLSSPQLNPGQPSQLVFVRVDEVEL